MPLLTLNQAAKACGKSKSALLNAIRGGRLSAKRDELNQWQIDPSELFRVYPANQVIDQVVDHQDDHDLPVGYPLENALLKQQVGLLERVIVGLEGERNDLRHRLDSEAEERRRLTAMLTHQPAPGTAKGWSKPAWALLIVLGVVVACVATWVGWPPAKRLPAPPVTATPEPTKPIPKPDGEAWKPDDGG